MTISRFAMLAILPLTICGACGRSRSETIAPPTLAVEFEEPYADPAMGLPKHMNIMEGGESATETRLDLLRRLDPAVPPSTDGSLQMQFAANTGKVVTTVYIIPPESDPQRYSDGHKRLLGTHSAVLNESVTLNELKDIGYVPFTIRIVKANPPQTAHPALISKVPSIQLAITEHGIPYFGDADTQSCSVILRNLSSRPVLAYYLSDGRDPKTGGTSGQGALPSYAGPAIDPKKDSRPLLFTFGRATKMTPQGRVPPPAPPQQIVLEAALFSDGSSKGEHKVAADLKAREMENLTFYRVITPIIDRIVGDLSLDDETRVARIKEEIFRISSEPDEAPLHSLEAEFPDVPAADLATDLTRGLDGAKNDVWARLDGYVSKCCQSPPPDHISVPEWWQRQRSRIETFLNSLR
jgi:hypothetical protein